MKFYYNGNLVRTSKTHEYRYAILNPDGKCHSCHGTLEAAQKELRRPIAECETAIEDDKKAIKALQEGRNYVDKKVGRRWYRVSLKGKDFLGGDRGEVTYWENSIEAQKRSIEYYKTRTIVELEARD